MDGSWTSGSFFCAGIGLTPNSLDLYWRVVQVFLEKL
jgi:hypothetical protein